MGEFSLTAIVLAMLAVAIGAAVYINPRLGLPILASAAVVTLVYALLRRSGGEGGGEG